MNFNPFSAQDITLKINVTGTASSSAALPGVGNCLRVVNDGTAAAFISVGTGTQTATVPATSSPVATCTPILPGTDIVFSIPSPMADYTSTGFTTPTPLNVSAITAGGTTTLYVSVGEGL